MSKKIRQPRRNSSAQVAFGISSGQAKQRNRLIQIASKKKELAERRLSRRALFVLGLMVLTISSLGAFAGWRTLPSASNTSTQPTGIPPALPANAPGKEFIYAGSALLATTEAFREPPNDIAVWRPGANGGASTWYILNAQQQSVAYSFGSGADTPIMRDFDGDGKTDFCVYRPSAGQWHIVKSSDGSYYVVTFGMINTDQPAAADYDGDGRADIAVWRPSNGTWYIGRSSDNTTVSLAFGQNGDRPEPADYDGDGKSDLAVWRDSASAFYVQRSSNGSYTNYSIGASGDKPVIGDYDGDGRADYAVWRPTDGYWRILYSATNSLGSILWGNAADIPVQGNYSDGDAKTDVAIWRPSNGTWHILNSSDGSHRQPVQWGQQGDIPVPAPYKR